MKRFYSDEDFLINSERLELGVTAEGEIIDDANLPNWAEVKIQIFQYFEFCEFYQDFHDFINKMRAALESDYISSNLHQWIDLIFGYKQSGEQATQAKNLFYPFTYEQNINWSKYKVQFALFKIIISF